MPRKKSSPQTDETKEQSTNSRKAKPTSMKKNSPSPTRSRSAKKTVTSAAMAPDTPFADPPDLHARIASRAHDLYLGRGGHHGMDMDDWLEAERQILNQGCSPVGAE